MTPLWTIYESPLLGRLTLVGGKDRLFGLLFSERTASPGEAGRYPDAFCDANRQLSEYFLALRRRFELDLDFNGTPLQRAVWEQLAGLPYGDTVSYTELAGLVSAGRTAYGPSPARWPERRSRAQPRQIEAARRNARATLALRTRTLRVEIETKLAEESTAGVAGP